VSIKVNLDAYVLPDDHRLYKFFPGKAYKFYDQVFDNDLAFIDVRGLDALGDDYTAWTDEDIVTAIAKDRVERFVADGGDRPSRLVRSTRDKANRTFLKGLLFEARKGDFIVMPTKDLGAEVQVGELLDEPGDLRTIRTSDGGYIGNYYGRRVKWLNPIQKRLLDASLIKLLQTPATFFRIRDEFRAPIYKIALDNYVLDGHFVATFRTSKRIFTSKDNLLSSLWFELIEVVEEAREEGKDLAVSSIYQLAVESEIDEDERNDLSIYVQSPGWFKLRSLLASPFVAMALFALASAGISFDEARAATVTAQVVQSADASCLGQVDQAVKEYLELLGKNRWEEACTLATKANHVATLKTKATLRKTRKRVSSGR
jgi:hypothetical protein